MLHTKPLSLLLEEASETGEHTLKRSLTATNLVAIGIGVIVGAGLFSLTGLAAANHGRVRTWSLLQAQRRWTRL